MADISADSLLPGGGFKPSFFSGALSVASGATGTIITLTAPAGKRVRLTSLSGNDSTFTVNADGVSVVTALALSIAGQSGFAVGKHTAASNTAQPGLIDYIEAFGTITVVKSAGSTANAVNYSYAYGD